LFSRSDQEAKETSGKLESDDGHETMLGVTEEPKNLTAPSLKTITFEPVDSSFGSNPYG